jgi:hypothetical protein
LGPAIGWVNERIKFEIEFLCISTLHPPLFESGLGTGIGRVMKCIRQIERILLFSLQGYIDHNS